MLYPHLLVPLISQNISKYVKEIYQHTMMERSHWWIWCHCQLWNHTDWSLLYKNLWDYKRAKWVTVCLRASCKSPVISQKLQFYPLNHTIGNHIFADVHCTLCSVVQRIFTIGLHSIIKLKICVWHFATWFGSKGTWLRRKWKAHGTVLACQYDSSIHM